MGLDATDTDVICTGVLSRTREAGCTLPKDSPAHVQNFVEHEGYKLKY